MAYMNHRINKILNKIKKIHRIKYKYMNHGINKIQCIYFKQIHCRRNFLQNKVKFNSESIKILTFTTYKDDSIFVVFKSLFSIDYTS